MPQLKLQDFSGMIPARDLTLLPETSAAYSRNAWLYRGNIQGYRSATTRHTCSNSSVQSVFRVPLGDATDISNSVWIELTNAYTDVIRGPVVADQFERYYFFTPGVVPSYSPLADIQSNAAKLKLGIPTPEKLPAISTIAPLPDKTNTTTSSKTVINADGTSTTTDTVTPITETRSYVYTYISQYGEEGAPSPPALVTAQVGSTYVISVTPPSASQQSGRRLSRIRIYRTVTDGAGYAQYYYVAEQSISTTTFQDTVLDSTVTANNILESGLWTPPPSDLQGCVAMPNGILAGWSNETEIWFCEPYRPHAWPASYAISVPYKIVGMGVMGTSLVILTEGYPYIATGVTPSSMTLAAASICEPCISRGSIVSGPDGVFYASANGLVAIAPGSAKVVTSEIMTRQDWNALGPYNFTAALYGNAYVAFAKDTSLSDSSGDNGILIDPTSPNVIFQHLRFPSTVKQVIQDEYTSNVYVLSGTTVYEWDDRSTGAQLPYLWRSKVFQFPCKQQFVAAMIFFDVPATVTAKPTETTRNTAQPQNFDATKQYFIMRVYADSRLVLTREVIHSGELIKIPSGFKANFWQFEVEGQVVISNIQVATSTKELGSV